MAGRVNFREALDAVPGNSVCDLRGAMEQTVAAVIKALQVQEEARPKGQWWIPEAVAVTVTAAAAGVAALFSPWAAVAVAAVLGAGTLLLEKKLTARRKPAVMLHCDQQQLARELKTVAQTLWVQCDQARPRDRQRSCDPDAEQEFFQWLQLFSVYVRRQGDIPLQRQYFELKAALKSMGIYLYDDLLRDGQGNLQLPNEEWFVDMRTGTEWTEVLLPVVHTKDRVLMHGHIQ